MAAVPSRLATSRGTRLVLFAALLTTALTGARGLFDESAASLQGDVPRYLMDGVFLQDFLRHPALSWNGLLDFARRCYAQYPALSIGHHPPLLPILLVPFNWIFGVSVLSGRVLIFSSFLAATWLLFTLGRRQCDARIGAWAALMFASHPYIVSYGQDVLSEMLTLALMLGALNALLRFRDTSRTADYLLFVVLAAFSFAAKQLAAFVVPVHLLLMLFADHGLQRLRQRAVMLWTLAGAVVVVPLLVATLILSPYNVSLVVVVFTRGLGFTYWRAFAQPLLDEHWMPLLMATTMLGTLAAVWRRDRRACLGVCWVISVLGSVVLVTGPYDVARYTIYAIPAYCLLAASLLAQFQVGRARTMVTAFLALTVLAQLPAAAARRPEGAGGYEEAAEFVLKDTPGPTVLYSASVDTGYFVFFVRKHDPERRLAILRSDKLLTTSFMAQLSVEKRIAQPADIYPILDRFGTRYVVIEDRPSGSEVLEWLRHELTGDRFVERYRSRVRTTDRRLRDVDLVVYEYKDAKPGDPDAQLDLNLPVVGREIRMRLADIVPMSTPAP